MGFVRQSFKRQIFVVFLAVTLFLVIFGGVLTIQGFQARIKSDYEKRDAEQEAVAIGKINDILSCFVYFCCSPILPLKTHDPNAMEDKAE